MGIKFKDIAPIAGSVVDAGLGLVLGGANDRRQLRQQGKLQALQIKGMKEMSDYNKEKELEMWNDTNYSAQKEHMHKAGLNPGLMYGMGGGGGTTVGGTGGSGVSGGNAPVGGNEVGMGLERGMQLQLLKAQKENIEADTANKLAGASNLGATEANTKFDLEMKNILKNNNIDTSYATTGSAEYNEKINKINYEEANASWEALKHVLKNPQESDNDPLIKATRANLMQKVSELEKTKTEIEIKRKEGTLKDDEHELNKLEMEIKDFKTELTKIGLSAETAGLFGKVLSLIFGRK